MAIIKLARHLETKTGVKVFAYRLQKAYDRSENSPEMIERKRELLQWYADYLDSIEPIKIIDVKNLIVEK